MFVSTLKSNLASPDGKDYTFTLGQYTLVVGRNEAGKSRLVSTPLTLALTDTADDLLGRDEVKEVHRLMDLAPFEGAGALYSILTFDDGATAAWGANRTEDGTVKRLFEPHPSIDASTVLPLRAIKAALLGNETTARKSFLAWTGQSITFEDVFATIPAHLHAVFRDVYEKVKGSPADRLLSIAEYAKTRAAEVEAEATAQEALVMQLSNLTPVAPDTLIQTRALVEHWQNTLAAAVAWEGSSALNPSTILQERATALDALDAAEAAVAGWQGVALGHRAAASAEQAATATSRLALSLLTETACEHGQCPACGNSPGSDSLRAWSAYHAAQVASASTSAATALREAENATAAWVNEVTRHKANLTRLDAMLESASAPGVPDPGVTVMQARTGLGEAQTALATQERAAGAEATIKQARDTSAALRADKPKYVDLNTHCTAAVTSILDKGVEEFSARVQKHLPERWTFAMEVKDGFKIGFLENGHIRTVLSGTAYDALQVAVAMAVAEMGGGAATLKGRKAKKSNAVPYTLVIPDDRDRDTVTLGQLMKAWSRSGFTGQVILEATEVPKGIFPKEWTLLDLDKWREGLAPVAMEVVADVVVDAAVDAVVEVPAAPQAPVVPRAPAPPVAPQPPMPPTSPMPPAPKAPSKLVVPPAPPFAYAPPAPPALAAPMQEKKWYWHEGSDAYTQLRPDEALKAVDNGELVEIEGTDEGAPDRHRASQDEPAPAAYSVPPPPTVQAEVQTSRYKTEYGGDVPTPQEPISGGGNTGVVEPPGSTPPLDTSDAAFKELKYRPETLKALGVNTRARLLKEQIPGSRLLLLKGVLTLFGLDGAPMDKITTPGE